MALGAGGGGTRRAVPLDDGWYKCPKCGFKFKASDSGALKGDRHRRCGQRLEFDRAPTADDLLDRDIREARGPLVSEARGQAESMPSDTHPTAHQEPFLHGLITGMVLVAFVALVLGSIVAPFVRSLDLVDIWSPGTLARILLVGLLVGTVFGIVFVVPTKGTGPTGPATSPHLSTPDSARDPSGAKPAVTPAGLSKKGDPGRDAIRRFNQAVARFRAGEAMRAAAAFGALCDDRAVPGPLRMTAGYARAVVEQASGRSPSIPSDFALRKDEMVVHYSLHTAAGLLQEQGIATAEPGDGSVVAVTEQRGARFLYHISYQDAMGAVLAVVKRIAASGATVHLSMEDDPTPQPLDDTVLKTVQRAGTGACDPVPLPVRWAEPVAPPAEHRAVEEVCTIGLTLLGGDDLDGNHALTRRLFSRLAAEYPNVSRSEPLIIMSKVDPHFGIRFYPTAEMTHRAEELEEALIALFHEAGVTVTHRGIVAGTVGA